MVVKHPGRVVEVAPGEVVVVIEASGACQQCRVQSSCMMGDAQEKIMSIATAKAAQFAQGEEVNLSVETTMGLKAITLAYILPVVVVMALLLLLLEVGLGEAWAGILSLSALGLYYLILYWVRDRLAKVITFEIHKI